MYNPLYGCAKLYTFSNYQTFAIIHNVMQLFNAIKEFQGLNVTLAWLKLFYMIEDWHSFSGVVNVRT